MHDRPDLVFGEGTSQQFSIPDVADDQQRVADRLPEAGHEIVQHHHPFAPGAQLQDHVAADIAGAARDQHGILDAHRLSRLQPKMRTKL